MKIIKAVDLRRNLKEFFDLAYNGEILFVARPAKKNVVIISETQFNKYEKALKDLEYLQILEKN